MYPHHWNRNWSTLLLLISVCDVEYVKKRNVETDIPLFLEFNFFIKSMPVCLFWTGQNFLARNSIGFWSYSFHFSFAIALTNLEQLSKVVIKNFPEMYIWCNITYRFICFHICWFCVINIIQIKFIDQTLSIVLLGDKGNITASLINKSNNKLIM